MTFPMTIEEYVKEAMLCPYCGSGRIESDRIEADGSGASARVQCHECKNRWTDEYTLTGYSDDEKPKTDHCNDTWP